MCIIYIKSQSFEFVVVVVVKNSNKHANYVYDNAANYNRKIKV